MAQLDEARLARRASGRLAAKAIIELAKETESPNPDWQTAFWDEMEEWFKKESLPERRPKPKAAMTDEEVHHFRHTEIRFGKYNGYEIDKIPLTYLDWLLGTTEEFNQKLTRYLKNEKVAEQLRQDIAAGY